MPKKSKTDIFLISGLLFFIVAVAMGAYALSAQGADDSLILKFGLASVFLVIVSLFCFILKTHKDIKVFVAELSGKADALKKLLFDLRDGTKTYYEEKRKTYRAKDGITVKITYGDSEELVKALDISYGGARFKTATKMQTDEIIDMNIFLPLYAQPIRVKAKIVRAKYVSGNGKEYDIGVSFLSMSEPDKKRLAENLRTIRH